jgi:hypothetical protein
MDQSENKSVQHPSRRILRQGPVKPQSMCQTIKRLFSPTFHDNSAVASITPTVANR